MRAFLVLIGVKVPPDIMRDLDVAAAREGLANRSELLRKIIYAYLGLASVDKVAHSDAGNRTDRVATDDARKHKIGF